MIGDQHTRKNIEILSKDSDGEPVDAKVLAKTSWYFHKFFKGEGNYGEPGSGMKRGRDTGKKSALQTTSSHPPIDGRRGYL